MEQVINNTDKIKHLTHGGVLYPGKNQLTKSQIKSNRRHPGFEADIKEGRIEIPELEDENEEYPIKVTENGWYRLSNGEKILGKNNAIEAQKELNTNG